MTSDPDLTRHKTRIGEILREGFLEPLAISMIVLSGPFLASCPLCPSW
jgi:hypothetical protein